jgi:PKD repeat protein
LTFPVSATDEDGDTLTYSATGLPSGATFANRVFSWTPNYDEAGSYQVTFTVSDGQLTDSEQITITVIHVSDRTAPAAHDFYPVPDAIQVPVNALIALTISDDGLGVDANTVAISVNNQLVYSGDSSLYESAYGACRRMGTRASYRYYYQPTQAFDFDEHVSVYVTASDAAHNAMTPVSYQFVTEMQSFGRNQAVSSSDDLSGHPAMATDSQGNLWAAWHAGPAGARDIYVAKRSSESLQWDAPVRLTNLASDQCNPAVAIGADNTLYVAWQDNRRGNWDVYVSASQDGSTWGDAVRVTDSNDPQMNPVVAIDRASPYRVYIAWERGNAGSRDIYLVSSTTAFASKTITQITSNPADQTEPALAVGADNTAYLVWTDQRNGSADIYGSSSASSWTNIPFVTGSGNQSHPAVAVEPGTSMLHVLWVDDAAGNLEVMHGASNDLPGSPISGTNIADDATGADQSAPVIAAAKDHWNSTHVYACWQDSRPAGSAHDSDLYLVEIRSGASGTNVLVGDDGANSDQSEPALGCDEYGQPVIVWTDSRGSVPQIYSSCSTYFKPVALTSALIARSTGGRVGVDPASISHDEDVSIQIPANACDCDVTVGISEIQNLPKFTTLCITGYEIGPSGVQFSFPATVTIPYTASGSSRATPYWYDAQTGTLSQQGMTEVTNKTLANGIPVVSFKTTHLSTFYVLESPLPTGGGGGGGGCALSPVPEGDIAEFFLPYGALALLMYLWKRRDRKQKEISKNASPR